MMQETLKKFGYPEMVVKEYNKWILFIRYDHTTLGSLVLLNKQDVDAFSKISQESFDEFSLIVREIELNLKKTFSYDKINYLMLMMSDPQVHFHIIPRYSIDKEFKGFIFKDYSWPKAVQLDKINNISPQLLNLILQELKNNFK